MNQSEDDISLDAAIDPDLDLLESYLDDAVDPAAAAALRVRLAANAVLAAALDGLRAERADRSAAFASLEPDDRAVDQLCWRVRGAVATEMAPPAASHRAAWASFLPDPWRVTRFTSAAAACVLLGFFGGRLGRGPTPSAVAVGGGTSQVAPPVAENAVDVPITDEYGRVVASQRFSSPDEAKRFLEDLHPTRDAAATTGGVDGPVRTASELRY